MQNKIKTALLISIIIIITTFLLDNLLLKAIPHIRIQFLNPIITFLGSSIGAIAFLMFLSLLFLYEKKPKLIFYLITAFALAFFTALILKYIILRPRPEIIPLIIKTSPSFPSAHALVASSTFFFVKKLKTKYLAITLTFLTAFSGFYTGVHYLSDIFAGIFLGIIISYLALKKLPLIFDRFHGK
jgi:undecaprenyl-diphosphatase